MSHVNENQMINLVIILLDKKLLTSRFLTTSPVHSAEFEKILSPTSYFAQRYMLTCRIDISDKTNYSHLVLILLAK